MRYIFLILLIVFCVSCATEEVAKQPNVIIIVTDDQGYGDVGFHGNSIIKTPNLDSFSTMATELTNFHVGTTCSPTRAGIMTGRNANRTGAWHTIAGASILNEDETTVAEVFSAGGYRTGMFGKWHLGDTYPFRPHDRGFDEAYYHGGGGVGQTPDYFNNNYFDDTYFRNGRPEKSEGYCTDVWFDNAIDFIDEGGDDPFFVYLATNAAHGPFNVPEEYLAKYEDSPLLEYQKRFYGMVTNIDANFGKLTDYLETSGLTDNTILIFTTDNGTAGGTMSDRETGDIFGFNPLRGIKGSQYDGGHRVPFLIRWPDGDIGYGKIDELTAHVDLLPTLAKLSNLTFTPSKDLDGMDISKLFKGESLGDRVLITDTQRRQTVEKYRNPSVMQGSWRLVNNTELYNTENDMAQERDVSAEFPDKVSELQHAYEDWWAKVEVESRHSIIPLGEFDGASEISVHDMHPTEQNGAIPWHQSHIRRGLDTSIGYYLIDVKENREYRIELSRWPLHTNLSLSDSVPEVSELPNINGSPAGVSLAIEKAFLNFGEVEFELNVNPSDKSIVFSQELPARQMKMQAWFELENGSSIPAYFIRIL